jgi:CRP-like cAMP-binding protein
MLDGFKKSDKNHQINIITAEDCLNALTDDEKKELLGNKMEIEFEAGETIIKKGLVASNIMYLESGLAKLDVLTDGKMSTVSMVAPKSFVGIICTFASHNFDFSSVALEKTKISLFDMNLFEKFVHQNGDFACHIIKHMSVLTSELIHRISRFTHKNIEGALSILLLDFSRIYQSDSFILPIKRKEMANMLGYSKESVINTLSKFNKEGILNVQEKNIKILDKQKLQQIGELG